LKQKFDVTGMTCSACSAHVEKAVGKLEGIQTVNVNLLQNSMVVEYDDTALSKAAAMVQACRAQPTAPHRSRPKT